MLCREPSTLRGGAIFRELAKQRDCGKVKNAQSYNLQVLARLSSNADGTGDGDKDKARCRSLIEAGGLYITYGRDRATGKVESV